MTVDEALVAIHESLMAMLEGDLSHNKTATELTGHILQMTLILTRMSDRMLWQNRLLTTAIGMLVGLTVATVVFR